MEDKEENNEFEYKTENENSGKPTWELEATESVPVDEKKETIHFPWFIAIIIGVLMVLIIACFIVVMVLGPGDPVSSSSQINVKM